MAIKIHPKFQTLALQEVLSATQHWIIRIWEIVMKIQQLREMHGLQQRWSFHTILKKLKILISVMVRMLILITSSLQWSISIIWIHRQVSTLVLILVRFRISHCMIWIWRQKILRFIIFQHVCSTIYIYCSVMLYLFTLFFLLCFCAVMMTDLFLRFRWIFRICLLGFFCCFVFTSFMPSYRFLCLFFCFVNLHDKWEYATIYFVLVFICYSKKHYIDFRKPLSLKVEILRKKL